MIDRRGATAQNWLDAPYNRWGFHHVGELAHTVPISRGHGPITELPRDERTFDGFSFHHGGQDYSLQQMLDATYTDAILVLHRGVVLFERYMEGMQPSDTHLLMSASKSLTAMLCGVLVGRGLLTPEDHVIDHIDELRDTAWEGCTIQQLLDMRVGVSWDYDIDEYTIIDVSDYRSHSRQDIPSDTAAWIRAITKSHPHGGPFRYCSLATDVLGWVLESTGSKKFAEMFSDHIWSTIGAEFDAEILLDNSGFAVVEGGICTTLRDLGRFGQMCLLDGQVDANPVVPAAWLDRLSVCDQDLIAAYAGAPEAHAGTPNAFYHDKWWITDAERGIFSASGMNGQQLLIHKPSQTVAVKFSTHPNALDTDLFGLQDTGLIALCESLL